MKTRDLGRHNNQTMEPTQHSRFTLSQLNSLLLNETAKNKRNNWRKFLQTCDDRTGARKIWKVIRSLKGSRPVIGSHPIQFESKTISSDADIAKAFKKQLTNARIQASDKLLRKTRRKIAKLTLLDNPNFSPYQLNIPLRTANSRELLGQIAFAPFT